MIVRRRLAVAGGIALMAHPRIVFSQTPGKVWRVGVLSLSSGPSEVSEAFREGLRSLGYIEGHNVLIEFRWADGKNERLPEMAEELVRLKVDVIVAGAMSPVAAAKRATSTIPIVMSAPSDPIGGGLIASLARPGGNVTGNSLVSTDLAGKRLQLLRELLPKVNRVATLVWDKSLTKPQFLEQTRMAAKQLGITLVNQEVGTADALAGAFAAMQGERVEGLVVPISPFITEHRKQIAELAARHRLPAIYENRSNVEVGGLISYGPDILEMLRRAAIYVDKIFKGAKPADLPVQQPTKFEFIINLKTAKALGITIPQSLLLRADEVIQ